MPRSQEMRTIRQRWRSHATTLGALILTGCAAIFSSGPTSLTFQSNPGDAEVFVNGVPRGRTPVVLELHADDEYLVTFRREGCADVTLPLETHVQAGFVVLDILAGIIGIAVDAATGEWKEFNDRVTHAQLDCQGAAPAAPPRVAPPQEPEPPFETPAALLTRAGTWYGTLTSRGGDPFQATLALSRIAGADAVSGVATYTADGDACVYRLTQTSADASAVRLAQALESPSGRCIVGLGLVLRQTGPAVFEATLAEATGELWATGRLGTSATVGELRPRLVEPREADPELAPPPQPRAEEPPDPSEREVRWGDRYWFPRASELGAEFDLPAPGAGWERFREWAGDAFTQTESFEVPQGRWRLAWRTWGEGTLDIRVFELPSGELVGSMSQENEVGTSYMALQEGGIYYVRVDARGLLWRLAADIGR